MSKLPENWMIVRIEDVITLNPKNDCDDSTEVGFVPLQLLGMRFRDLHAFERHPWSVVKKGYTHFANGDVLLARITPSFENGKAGIARNLPNGLGAGSTEYFVCRPLIGAVTPEYLLAYFKTTSFLLNGEHVMTGASGHKRVPKQYLLKNEFPLAPFNEQKRIVDKLDALLRRVDACRDRLDLVSSIIKQFRQSVLNAATSGELTKDWVYTSKPEIWQEALIGDLLVEKPRNGYSPRAVEFETETRSLTLTATTSGRFNPAHVKYIDEKISEDSYLWLEPGDILIQRANTLEHVGVSAIYDGLPKHYIYPDLMMKCRANSRVLTKFLYSLLSSDDVRSFFRKNATGTTGNMPKINQQIVLSAPVWVPPIDEQQEIVRRTDLLLAYADCLETRYKRACVIVKRLTSALLDKAFRGELVPQDPSDDSASVLLERIHRMPAKVKTTVPQTRLQKPKSDRSPHSQVIMLKRKEIQPSHLSSLLRARGSMTAETLWSASQLEIDDFYDQLKDEEASGFLKETREDSVVTPRLLEAI